MKEELRTGLEAFVNEQQEAVNYLRHVLNTGNRNGNDMGLRRLRGRLDQLQGEANQTMALAQALIAEVQDGVSVELYRTNADPLLPQVMAFIKGEQDTLPIGVRVKIEE